MFISVCHGKPKPGPHYRKMKSLNYYLNSNHNITELLSSTTELEVMVKRAFERQLFI